MTLLINEIHLIEGLRKTALVAVADRRITTVGGRHGGTHPKLFPIPYLNGAISYMGLASFDIGKQRYRMWELLPDFIRKLAPASGLGAFAHGLKARLEDVVPTSLLAKHPSAFHICGYDRGGQPDYWWLTNIREMNGAFPVRWESTYKAPGSHFLGRDAKALGWDGIDPMSIASNRVKIYRGGDFRVHAVASELIDRVFEGLEALEDYKRPRTPAEYKRLALFKFNCLAHLHQKWLKGPTVGDKIDVMVWTATAGTVKAH